MYSFPDLEPVHCSMSYSNCCFLTCLQLSQEAGQGIWYSHLFKNFSQFIVIHTVKGFSTVNEADVFLEFSCFFFFIINGCWIWVIIGVKLKNRHQGLAYGEIDIQIQLVCFKLLLPICWIISGFIKICSCILGPSNLPPSIYSKEQFIHIHRSFTSMFISHSLK